MLSVQDLEVVYPRGNRALARTNVTFAGGAFTVLLGPSGAGKSTLLRALNGLVQPTHGRVCVDGLGDIADPSVLREHRRSTAMVFQQHHLIGRISVFANVLLGRLGFHRGLRTLAPYSLEEKYLAMSALDRVGLLTYANRRADQLSGGEQQRVGIARALVQQPRVILADEPVASLDPGTGERALKLFREICLDEGITALVSLHQVPFARRFADRIVALSAGQIVFDGSPRSLSEAVLGQIYGNAPVHDRVPAANRRTPSTPRPEGILADESSLRASI